MTQVMYYVILRIYKRRKNVIHVQCLVRCNGCRLFLGPHWIYIKSLHIECVPMPYDNDNDNK